MKEILLLCATVLYISCLSPSETYACIGSDCTPCPDGFSITKKCCRNSDKKDCVNIENKIEDCGSGQWKVYPHSLPVSSKECCKDASENNCYFTHTEEYCGTGIYKDYPYSPIKKCCKDTNGNDCIIIKAKRQCGEFQLKEYPLQETDCCNPDLTECTGHITDCPRCI